MLRCASVRCQVCASPHGSAACTPIQPSAGAMGPWRQQPPHAPCVPPLSHPPPPPSTHTCLLSAPCTVKTQYMVLSPSLGSWVSLDESSHIPKHHPLPMCVLQPTLPPLPPAGHAPMPAATLHPPPKKNTPPCPLPHPSIHPPSICLPPSPSFADRSPFFPRDRQCHQTQCQPLLQRSAFICLAPVAARWPISRPFTFALVRSCSQLLQAPAALAALLVPASCARSVTSCVNAETSGRDQPALA